MPSKYKSGDYAGTPAGYHRLGRSAPRTRVREYELRRRKLFIPQTVEAASSHHSHLTGPPIYRRARNFRGVRPIELNHDSPFARGLVGWWPVGAAQHWGSSRLLDLSPYGNHGTLTNMDPATDWVHDGERAGLDFDGVDDEVSLGSVFGPLNSVGTMTVWLSLRSYRGISYVAALDSPSRQVHLSIKYSDFAYLGSRGHSSGATLSVPIQLNVWHHCVLAMPVGQTILYVDGQLSGISTYTGSAFSSDTLTIGKSVSGGATGWDGQLDDVRIYNRALSAAEIKQLYEETKDGSYGSLEKKPVSIFFIPKPEEPQPFSIVRASPKRQPAVRPIELNLDSPFAKGLVGWWPTGNRACWKSGKLLDLSPYRNHGTLTNMDPQTDWVHDGERAGLDFDGVDDKVETLQNTVSATAISLIAWVLPRIVSSAWLKIIHKNPSASGKYVEFELTQYATTTTYALALSIAGTYRYANGGTIQENKWSLVCGTWCSGEKIRVYQDGAQVGSSAQFSGSIDQSTDNVFIGGRLSTGQYWNGKLDDIRIYNRALSAAEVKQLYEETKDGSYGSLEKSSRAVFFFDQDTTVKPFFVRTERKTTQPAVRHLELNHDSPFARGLVGWWPMGNKACWKSGKLLDLSPYGNHGTLTNMDPATDWVVDDERAGLDFDGAYDHVLLVGVPYLTRYTISLWCWSSTAPTATSGKGPAHREQQWQYNWDHASAAYRGKFGHNDGTWPAVSLGALVTNAWLHLVGTYNGTDIVAYNNGAESGRINAGDPIDGGEVATLGKHALVDSWWDGKVDDVRIYNRALSAAEVKQLYEETKDGSYGSLAKPTRSLVYFPETASPSPPLAKRHRRRLSYPRRSRFPSWL